MSKKAFWIESIIFLSFISVFFILNLVLPDKSFSEQENRYLQQKPEFSFSSLFSGRFTSDFEKYTTDQFTLRDSWTALKARMELLSGKSENNGVFLCEDETLIESFDAPDTDRLDAGMSYVNSLAQNTDAEVYFALIPDKSEILGGMLPENAPNDSESALIEYCYGLSDAGTIDILSPLSAHSDEYIFYRTDHHWTSLGAYYGFTAVADALGLDCPEPGSYTDRQTVSTEFYGTTYSSSGFSWVSPDSMEIFVGEPDGLKISNYKNGSAADGVLYDFSCLEKKDKYSMFFGGNTPLLEIKTGVEDAPSLLIIRDSYTDSLLPFLLDSFSEINVLDLRYYRSSLAQYIEESQADTVLVLYSVSNFCSDTNLFLLAQ